MAHLRRRRRQQTAFVATAGTSAQPAASSVSKTVGVRVGKEGGGEREEEWGGSGGCVTHRKSTVELADPCNQSGVQQSSTDISANLNLNCLTLFPWGILDVY